ncbi:glycerophosphodiester phosphodiesterase [Bacillus infantis]|nr:glycerophosphodiester phosphodiesterase family protein [Bacillus infantis]
MRGQIAMKTALPGRICFCFSRFRIFLFIFFIHLPESSAFERLYRKESCLFPFRKKNTFAGSLLLGILVSFLSFAFQPLAPFQSIAHRGAVQIAPENTMAAFEKAYELGFDFIELDVWLSSDHQPVVIHDGDVGRTTGGDGLVTELSASQLKELDAGSWFSDQYKGEKIPLLKEVVKRFGGKIGLLIEMKGAGSEANLAKEIAVLLNQTLEEGVDPDLLMVQSFNIADIRTFSTLSPQVKAGILVSKPLDMFQLASYRSFADFLSVHHAFLSKSFVTQAKSFGYSVNSWTVTQEQQFAAMQRLKVNGIISDLYPDSSLQYCSTLERLFSFVDP